MYPNDFNALRRDTINVDIRQGGEQEFAGSIRALSGRVAVIVSVSGRPRTVSAWSAGGNADSVLEDNR